MIHVYLICKKKLNLVGQKQNTLLSRKTAEEPLEMAPQVMLAVTEIDFQGLRHGSRA